MRLDGKAVVVTGATKGIGRAVVDAVVAKGARVGAVARSAEDLEALGVMPGVAAWARADVGVRAEAEAAAASLSEALGGVDVLVNNAGVGLYGPVVTLDPDDAERLVRVNYFGTLYMTRALLPEMMRRGSGHIVNVASIAGHFGSPFEAAYAASKFAVVGFTEALAVEASACGVGVSMVNPGPVDTDFFDTRGTPYARSRPKKVSPQSVADAVVRAVEKGTFQQIVPAALAAALPVRHLSPRVYLAGTKRTFTRELKELADEVRRAPN
ncbi:MAG: SDR family NAD(P)-dependent oxidoreductase [Acidimicrobiales bacterium]